MPKPIDFYFDFSSPYGYLASHKIDALAAKYQREVNWHPILLGIVFKQTGAAPLTSIPIKGDYAARDFARSARFHGIEDFKLPSKFPVPTQTAARLVVWQQKLNPSLSVELAKALYHAFFAEDIDISDPEKAIAVASRLGIDADEARRAINDPEIKDALKDEVERAIAAGVFGSPFIVIDGEPFWGVDRLDQAERWLAKGPW